MTQLAVDKKRLKETSTKTQLAVDKKRLKET